MFVSYLSLLDFRSYKSLELELNRGSHIFLGDNGEGKTNIAEALMFLALLSSHRVSTTAPLIRLGSEKAYIRAKIEDENQNSTIELEINNGRANRAKLNQNPVRSQREVAGIVKAICFSPLERVCVHQNSLVRTQCTHTKKFDLFAHYLLFTKIGLE